MPANVQNTSNVAASRGDLGGAQHERLVVDYGAVHGGETIFDDLNDVFFRVGQELDRLGLALGLELEPWQNTFGKVQRVCNSYQHNYKFEVSFFF